MLKIHTLIMASLFCGLALISPIHAQTPTKWTLWSPQQTLQIALAENATDNEKDAAQELQNLITQMSDRKPDIVAENAAQKERVIYIGNTLQAAAIPTAKWPEEVRSREESYRFFSDATRKALFIQTTHPMALKYAVADFATRYGEARWYLPTNLFQVVPKKPTLELASFDHIETPSFAPRTFSYIEQGARYSYPGEQDPQFKHDRWALRNRLSVDGRLHYGFNHNLFTMVVPSRDFETHPEWFPLINGKRFRPPSDNYQQWQPELTDPVVVEKAIQAGREFFQNSSRWWEWYSLSINDGDGWSESPQANAINGTPRYFRGRLVQSNVYYDFVNKVATALLKEFPDRQIGLIAYYSVEAPPTNIEKLPPNVNVVITQATAQHFNAEYREMDQKLVQDWIKVANGNVYRYDYSTLGWMVPRYYPTLLAQDAREMKKLGLKGYFTEDVPIWANNTGPLLWLSTQLWWNPDQDEKQLLKKFCDDLFGPASPAMQKYFVAWEKAWMRQKSGRLFTGFMDIPTQVSIYFPQDRLDMESAIHEAQRLANTDIEKQRVDFFFKGWKNINFYLSENEQANRLQTETGREKIDAALTLLKLLDEDAVWSREFRQDSPLLNATILLSEATMPQRGRWPDIMRARALAAFLPALEEAGKGDPAQVRVLLNEIKTRLANTTSAHLAPLLEEWVATPTPANVLKNISFQKAGQSAAGWQEGLPDDWGYWHASTGTTHYRDNTMRMSRTDEGVIIQEAKVQEDQIVLATVRYRSKPGVQTPTVLSCRWTNKDGWFPVIPQEGVYDLIVTAAPSEEWQTISVLGRVPKGATGVKFMFGTNGQGKDDWVEFQEPYFGVK